MNPHAIWSRRQCILVICVFGLAAACGSGSSQSPGTNSDDDDLSIQINSGLSSPDTSILQDPLLGVYTESGALSEDAQRILTVAALQLSLEQYSVANNRYPDSAVSLLSQYAALGPDGRPLELTIFEGNPPLYEYSPGAEGQTYELSVVLLGGRKYVVEGTTDG